MAVGFCQRLSKTVLFCLTEYYSCNTICIGATESGRRLVL